MNYHFIGRLGISGLASFICGLFLRLKASAALDAGLHSGDDRMIGAARILATTSSLLLWGGVLLMVAAFALWRIRRRL
jgi:hypothetical protein